jgi:hypothetical protein
MVDELIDRGESAARMTVEVKVLAWRVLFPDSVVDRETGEDQVYFVLFGCSVVSLLSIACMLTVTYSISC